MTGSLIRRIIISTGLFAACGERRSPGVAEQNPEASPSSHTSRGAAALRDGFVENLGQAPDAGLRFYAFAGPITMGLGDSSLLLSIESRATGRGALVRQSYLGARTASPRGDTRLDGVHHYFVGSDPGRWRPNVRRFASVVYDNLYPGVDVVYSMSAAGLKYEFRLAAGVAPEVIRWAYEGIDGLSLDETTRGLVIHTAAGDLLDEPPIAWQAGESVACRAMLLGREEAGFTCEGTDPDLPLVIDPLVHATLLGGDGLDAVVDVEPDGLGGLYVTGGTDEILPSFPATPGAYQVAGEAFTDAFVARFSADGDLVFATFLAGADLDDGMALVVDPTGRGARSCGARSLECRMGTLPHRSRWIRKATCSSRSTMTTIRS